MKARKILFPTDLSAYSNAAWPMAVSLARDTGAEILVVHVEQPAVAATGNGIAYAGTQPDRRYVTESLAQFTQDESLEVAQHVMTGDPASSIVQFADHHNIDVIVMSTHGRTGLTRLLMGSVAEAVVRRAKCPVLTFKPREKSLA